MIRCMGCMEEISEEEKICRHCGYHKGTDIKEAYYLLPGKMIGDKYMVGRVLGYGGFGVTYIGWDTTLHRKVAIKEYLPSDFATRSYGIKMLTVFSGEAMVQFEAGLKSFISEAKRLAKFNSVPEIVDIYDCFMGNGTGYIIMEFLEGMTVKELLAKQQKISVEKACSIIKPVLRGLGQVHKEGIIHRDIAPDNIFITKNKEIKILDFGAARYATAVQSRSLSVILKPGYAPEEQYRSRGEQGSWTDVYAIGATFYRMITGVRPEESIERMVEDQLQPPSRLGIEIDPNVENALMNSLNVKKEYRTQDAESFYQALASQEKVERIIEVKAKKEDLKLPGWIKWTAGAAGALVCICAALFITGNLSFTSKQIDSKTGVEALKEGECYVPDVSGMSYDEAEKILKEKDLTVVINGMNYSESIEKNKILSQEPNSGEKLNAKGTVYVIMSGGNQEVMMPDLVGMDYEEAKRQIKAQKLIIKKDGLKEEYSDFIEKGRVISQNIDAEKRIEVETEIELIVSKGSLSTETKVLTVPDLRGLTKEKALKVLENLKKETGFTYSIGKVKNQHSVEVKKGKIISQGLEPGTEVRTDKPITLVISKGPKKVEVPNLVYRTKEEAVKLLEDFGFKVQIEEEYSSKVSKGLVISQSQEAGTEEKEGTTITIVVSLGESTEKDTDSSGSSNSNSQDRDSGNHDVPEEPQVPQIPQEPQIPEEPQAPQIPEEPQQPTSQEDSGIIEDTDDGIIEDTDDGIIEDI